MCCLTLTVSGLLRPHQVHETELSCVSKESGLTTCAPVKHDANMHAHTKLPNTCQQPMITCRTCGRACLAARMSGVQSACAFTREGYAKAHASIQDGGP